jgi:hypothetical protein
MAPFGFNEKEYEKKISQRQEQNTFEKKHLLVNATYNTNGKLTPNSFTWDDGREYKITNVLNCISGKSLKNFSFGFRYKCQSGNKDFFLYFDCDSNKWWIEMKIPQCDE